MDRAELLEFVLGKQTDVTIERWDLSTTPPSGVREVVPFSAACRIPKSSEEVFFVPSNGKTLTIMSDSDDRTVTLPPSFVIETSQGRMMSGWRMQGPVSRAEYGILLGYLDPTSPPRTTETFRLPDTISTKHGTPFTCCVTESSRRIYALSTVFGLNPPEQTAQPIDPAWFAEPGPFEEGNLRAALHWMARRKEAVPKTVRILMEQADLNVRSLMLKLIRLAGMTEHEAIWCAEAAACNPYREWRYGAREELARQLVVSRAASGSKSITEEITRIRGDKSDKRRSFEIRAKMATRAMKDFEANTTILRATDMTRWAIDKRTGIAMELIGGSDPIKHYIADRYGINPVDLDHKHLLEDMMRVASRKPNTSQATSISYYERSTERMLISFGGREIAILTKDGMEFGENGEGGVIFRPVPGADATSTKLLPVEAALEGPVGAWWDRVLPPSQLENLTRGKPEEISALLHVWTLFFLFRNLAASRPILALLGNAGSGKCLGRGTPVLLYNGTVKPVEEIVTGDLLMGPDSTPRRVMSTTVGVGPLYRVNPTRGRSWICNDEHILTIVNTVNNKVVDIPVKDWAQKGKSFRKESKLFSPEEGVDFEDSGKSLSIDPYFLGVWLGDGRKHIRGNGSTVAISKDDKEIKDCCEEEAAKWGLHTKTYYRYEKNRDATIRIAGEHGRGNNPLLSALQAFKELPESIPNAYLTASRSDREQLLAGLIDTDGYVSRTSCVDIVQRKKGIAEGIALLARSLGLHVTESIKYANGYEQPYYRCSISGKQLSGLPMRIPRKQVLSRKSKKRANRMGFTVDPVGEGDYYGFTLDGDGRFLLGDFTVTHNTTFSKKIHLLLYGQGVKLFQVKDRDSWTTTVSNYPLALFDNVDTPTPWWLPPALALSITPTDATKRTLYSNNTPYVQRMDAMVGVSSHDAAFLKDDVIDRMILIQVQRIAAENRLEETPMLDAVSLHREELLAGMMADVVRVLRTPRPVSARGSSIRIVDFAAIGQWIAQAIGKSDEFAGAIGTLSIHQKAKVLEEDIGLVMALEDAQRLSPLATGWATHTQLWQELMTLADDGGEALKSQYKNAQVFGRKLVAISTQLHDAIGLDMQDDPHRGWHTFKLNQSKPQRGAGK